MKALDRHLHLVGFTGTGKTTALLTMLFQIFCMVTLRRCVIVIDRLGGFSLDLKRWFASPFCPRWVRDRFVYIEAAREDVTVPINPLLHSTPGEGYYRTARAAELILRGWELQDLTQTPRLMRWLFNAMWAVAQLGLTIADSVHLLFPHSPLHRRLLDCLPEALQHEWRQIMEARGNQAEVQLESCRNRLKPIFDSPILRALFSSHVNRMDVGRWMDEGRIVVLNLAPMGKLPETSADLIGGMVVNEVLSVARSRSPEDRRETLLVLDEFQRFVKGSDLEFALAESRQLKVNLVLSHQSFSQLKSDTVDLTSLIFQAQNRLMLKVRGPDATLLAEELASLTFDPMVVKAEIWHRCQRISGHRVVELHNHSTSESLAEQWSRQVGENWNEQSARGQTNQRGESRRGHDADPVRNKSGAEMSSESNSNGGNETVGSGGSRTVATTNGTAESLVPVFEEYLELASRTYWTFDENVNGWGRKIRRLHVGQGILELLNDDSLYEIDVLRTAPGHLGLAWEAVRRRLPEVVEAYEAMLEANFRQECFVSPAQVEAEARERLQRVLCPRIDLGSDGDADEATVVEVQENGWGN